MRRKKQTTWLLLASALLCGAVITAACSSDTNPSAEEPMATAVSVGFVTRTDGGTTSPWENGDKITITADGEGNEPKTITYNGSTWSENNLSLLLPSTLTAYYPATAVDGTFIIPTDQNAGIHAADLMVSESRTIDAVPTKAVDFTMQHKLCRVVFTITYGAEFEGKTASAWQVISLSDKVTLGNGRWETSGTSVPITPFVSDKKVEAIVAPGTYSTQIISVTVDDETLKAKYSGELVAGNSYSFNLKVGRDKVEITSATVDGLTGWGTAEDETDL